MNTASLEPCKELYELSGWWFRTTEYHNYWSRSDGFGVERKEWDIIRYFGPRDRDGTVLIPAYDLGYLLRKLPTTIKDAVINMSYGDEGYAWGYVHSHAETRNSKTLWHTRVDYKAQDIDLENALCKLAIELFKQGVLTK